MKDEYMVHNTFKDSSLKMNIPRTFYISIDVTAFNAVNGF